MARKNIKKPSFILGCTQALTSPAILFYALFWLMVLLVLGTVAQRYIGLYRAQHLFFSSFITWFGIFPLPGGYTTLALISANLCAKLFLDSVWNRQKAGIIITHMGALLLLAGGLISSLFAQEGNMVLLPGESRNVIADYHQRELAVTLEGKTLLAVPYQQLKPGFVIQNSALPFTIRIQDLCYNCRPEKREVAEGFRNVAAKVKLADAPHEKEDEGNQSGVTFSVEGAGGEQDGIHLSFEPMPHHPTIEANGKTYTILMRRALTPLPFTIQLLDFRKEVYPGTDKARSYESTVKLTDGAREWRSTIRMNHPLRYKGYTFYQSSFLDNGEKQASVLAAVKNNGRMFPYISSAMMCAGMLLHLVLRRKSKKGRG